MPWVWVAVAWSLGLLELCGDDRGLWEGLSGPRGCSGGCGLDRLPALPLLRGCRSSLVHTWGGAPAPLPSGQRDLACCR